MDPEDKAHPKFGDVSDLEFFMFPREDQMAGKSATRLKLGNAVSEVFHSYTSVTCCGNMLLLVLFSYFAVDVTVIYATTCREL